MKIAQSDYDKPHRCPGWSGSGWTYNKRDWCDDPQMPEGWSRWGRDMPNSIYGTRLWFLRVHRTACCGTYVLPYSLVWLNWRTWTNGVGWMLLRQKFEMLRWSLRRKRADKHAEVVGGNDD